MYGRLFIVALSQRRDDAMSVVLRVLPLIFARTLGFLPRLS